MMCNFKDNNITLKKAISKLYPAEIIMDTDDVDNLVLPANTPAQAKSLLLNLEKAARGIVLYTNSEESECMCINQDDSKSSLNVKLLKLIDQFIYLGSNISSTERNINICIVKAWTAINRLMTIWKSYLSDKIKWEFFQAVLMSVQLYGCMSCI